MTIRMLLAATALASALGAGVVSTASAADTVEIGSNTQTGGATAQDRQTMAQIRAQMEALRNRPQH
jgi:hypothetical protein